MGAGVYYIHKDMTRKSSEKPVRLTWRPLRSTPVRLTRPPSRLQSQLVRRYLSSPSALTPNSWLPSIQRQSLRLMRKNTIRRKHSVLFLTARTLRKKIAQTEKKTKMSTDQKRSGCGKYMAGAALVAAGAGVYYIHKDMTKEELREAGQTYMETTQEYSCKAYEATKPVAIAACEKASELSRCAYAKLMAALYPETESEVDAEVYNQEEESVAEQTQYESEVQSEL